MTTSMPLIIVATGSERAGQAMLAIGQVPAELARSSQDLSRDAPVDRLPSEP